MAVEKILNYVGIVGVIVFLLIYGFELAPHHDGPLVSIKWIKENLGTEGFWYVNL